MADSWSLAFRRSFQTKEPPGRGAAARTGRTATGSSEDFALVAKKGWDRGKGKKLKMPQKPTSGMNTRLVLESGRALVLLDGLALIWAFSSSPSQRPIAVLLVPVMAVALVASTTVTAVVALLAASLGGILFITGDRLIQ